jgi:nickel superoxide dismutase
MKKNNLFNKVILNFIPKTTAFAHCDIPCGIYDPKAAETAAETVEKMMTLIADLGETNSKDALNSMARYVDVKEKHAEIVKHEVRIIWGDYFKPPHLEQFPDIHDKTWNILKTASACRVGTSLDDAKKLREQVAEFAKIFWETKK